ncbi:hypothetical protein BU14_0625s0003, partial [Porphyra umbilicalis]
MSPFEVNHVHVPHPGATACASCPSPIAPRASRCEPRAEPRFGGTPFPLAAAFLPPCVRRPAHPNRPAPVSPPARPRHWPCAWRPCASLPPPLCQPLPARSPPAPPPLPPAAPP